MSDMDGKGDTMKPTNELDYQAAVSRLCPLDFRVRSLRLASEPYLRGDRHTAARIGGGQFALEAVESEFAAMTRER